MKKTGRMGRLGFLVMALALVAAACGGGGATPDASGNVDIDLSEFEISPSAITAKVGDTVTFRISNEGAVPHEWMMGREVSDDEGFPSGFHENFFGDTEGLMVAPMDAAMGMEGGMDMTDDTMAGDDAMADAEHGFMVMREPGEEVSITITLTEAHLGEWEMGCFVDDGAHYEAGMKGSFTVEAADA
ncbi:MAG: hypothetical protein M3132_09760 [Actinomycetia bacterium]|nr:hypothetical protein [Actinomycetes bacterium]